MPDPHPAEQPDLPVYLQQTLAELARFEGSVPWMYLDTVGKVTVGVGLMLPDAMAATVLPFLLTGQPAAPDIIAAEFHRVSSLPKGMLPHFYQAPGSPGLAPETIAEKLQTVLTGFEEKLRARLPGYDAFPDCAKQALLDMAYNLGPAGLLNGYPRLMQAIQAGDWARASSICGRRGLSPERNAWTKAMFLAAASLHTIQARAESLAYRIGAHFWWLPEWLFGR